MSKDNDMREYHANCLKYLINYQKDHPGFYFVPRKYNTRGRLDMNYYFIGDNNYMMISFWDGGDSYEKIHNINFGIEYGGHCFIEVSSNDNNERAVFLEELVDILTKQNKSNLKTNYSRKKNKWRREYNTNLHYIDVLQDFIDNDKPIIDKYILANPQSGIKLAHENLHDKYVLKLFKESGTQESQGNKKHNKENKGGEILVDPHAYRMRLQHNELQNALVKFLENSTDYQDVLKESNNVDICAKSNGKTIFFELKTSEVKYSIREAIGQLLEYNHYSNVSKADKLIVVTKFEPKEDDIIYIEFLRKTYDLPIYYQMFDMRESKLSKEY